MQTDSNVNCFPLIRCEASTERNRLGHVIYCGQVTCRNDVDDGERFVQASHATYLEAVQHYNNQFFNCLREETGRLPANDETRRMYRIQLDVTEDIRNPIVLINIPWIDFDTLPGGAKIIIVPPETYRCNDYYEEYPMEDEI